jgi:DNA-directed RNA polymerase I, II, and III subunit RPABC5
MLIPVKCFTCGTVIGDKYVYYQEEVIKIKIQRQINPDVIQYLDHTKIDKTVEGEVLDTLRLTKLCCRRHMLTHVNIF